MHIFISYAKSDTRELATEIRRILVAISGITAWMDGALEPADSWAAQIEREIDRSDLMVVLLSPDVNRAKTPERDRSFVLKEISYAQSAGIKIMPIMAQKTKLPVQLADAQYIDFTKNAADGMRHLIRYVSPQTNTRSEPFAGVIEIQARYAYEKVRRIAIRGILGILAVVIPGLILAFLLGTDRFADPVARFSALPREGQAPLSVVFNNTSDNATSFEWDFGDNSQLSNESDPVHIFEFQGTFQVTLKVCNRVGQCDSQTINIRVMGITR